MGVWTTSPLAVAVRCRFCGCFLLLFFPPPNYVAFWDSQTPYRPTCESISYCVETSPLSWLPPQDGSPSLNLLSPFLSFIFCPTSSWREWTAFWVHGVLCQRPEVVFWNFLGVQMFFRWICEGENGFPILFFHHLSHWLSLLFSMLSRFVITFLPRRKHLLISWLQSPSAVILEPPKIKYWIYSFVNERTDSSSILTDPPQDQRVSDTWLQSRLLFLSLSSLAKLILKWKWILLNEFLGKFKLYKCCRSQIPEFKEPALCLVWV